MMISMQENIIKQTLTAVFKKCKTCEYENQHDGMLLFAIIHVGTNEIQLCEVIAIDKEIVLRIVKY